MNPNLVMKKTSGSVLAVYLITATLALSVLPLVPSTYAVTGTTGCTQQISQAASDHQATFNQNAAIAVAESDGRFSQYRQSNPVFSSIYGSWTFDSDCNNVTLEAVTVVYQLANSSVLQVRENPQANQVTSITVQHDLGAGWSHSSGQQIWSGYEFGGNSAGNTPEYQVDASWTIPAVSQPYTNGCEGTPDCELLVWPGLVHNALNSPSNTGVAQAGTRSELQCPNGTSKCTGGVWSYGLWYEFYPQQSTLIECYNSSAAGDSITSYVTNEASYLGTDYVNYWGIIVTDSTVNQSCTVNSYYDNGIGTPYLADLIFERTYYGIPIGFTLPKFTTTTMTGGVWTNSPYNSYTSGWYNGYIMQNGSNSTRNISYGAVSSGNAFTSTWSSSYGT